GDALAAAGARIVITGAGWDEPLAAEIRRRMRCDAEDTTGRLTLGGLAGLLSRCVLVVSNDTGPLHLGAAVGAATVGIYWCFNLVTGGPVETARHRPFASWRTTCPVCKIDRASHRCDHHPSFVADVPAEQVVAAALDLVRP
ncbi:MAG TPA: glycosyltransferase family 9 protein, partial [Thermomicrobiales bacterium]|nr:glycosyltransferase family 9 protein [Thermomicrobiales bacterium]